MTKVGSVARRQRVSIACASMLGLGAVVGFPGVAAAEVPESPGCEQMMAALADVVLDAVPTPVAIQLIGMVKSRCS